MLSSTSATPKKARHVIAIYSHNGYQKAQASDYDNERAAQKLIQELTAANYNRTFPRGEDLHGRYLPLCGLPRAFYHQGSSRNLSAGIARAAGLPLHPGNEDAL